MDLRPDIDDAAYAEGRRELEAYLARDRARLVGLARRILRDEHEAEDIVQESVAGVLRRLAVERPRKIGAYARRAVEWNALKVLARRRTGVSLDETRYAARDEDEVEGEPEIAPVTVEQALMQLPPAQQVVIRMKYYMGYSFRQIGEAMAISMNTAASRCRYALAALRAQLGEPSDRPGPENKE